MNYKQIRRLDQFTLPGELIPLGHKYPKYEASVTAQDTDDISVEWRKAE